MIRAYLLHLSMNMWSAVPQQADDPTHSSYRPFLRFDEALWRELLTRMARAGQTMLVLDLGDAVAYASHPEIALADAWSAAKLRDELARCRDAGLEPIPKLNFSAAHDAWLGAYRRMRSTPRYYAVCRDLIREACELFDGPRLFHLGMDEETARFCSPADLRSGERWWHDLNLLVAAVAASGARAWVWSDVIWEKTDAEFAANMPRSVVQSNWYYAADFVITDAMRARPNFNPGILPAFERLAALGYDQIPCGSNWAKPDNYRRLVDHCTRVIAPERLLGFLMAPWVVTLPPKAEVHRQAIDCVAAAHAGAA